MARIARGSAPPIGTKFHVTHSELRRLLFPGRSLRGRERRTTPHKPGYVAWCSDGFRELKELPNQATSRLIAGAPLPTQEEALQHAYESIKTQWETQQAKRPRKAGKALSLLYTAWLFQGR